MRRGKFSYDTASTISDHAVWCDFAKIVTIDYFRANWNSDNATGLNTIIKFLSVACQSASVNITSVVAMINLCQPCWLCIFCIGAHNATGLVAVCNNCAWVVACIYVGTTGLRSSTNDATYGTVCFSVSAANLCGCTITSVTAVGDLCSSTACTNDATDCGICSDCAWVSATINKDCWSRSSSCTSENATCSAINI